MRQGAELPPVRLGIAVDRLRCAPSINRALLRQALASSFAVPLGIGVAVYITEMCPRSLRGILSFFTELLAAIPSVIYGLWAVFVLVQRRSQISNNQP